MVNFFKRLFGKNKPSQNEPIGKEKLMRPHFTDKEAIAMGRLAVSIVGSRINQPEAMIKFSYEYEGYTVGDLKSMTNMGMPDFLDSISIFSQMTDPLKKTYAAGFFAAIVKACHAENDAQILIAYHNCVEQMLKINGMEDINVAANYYEGFEHGK